MIFILLWSNICFLGGLDPDNASHRSFSNNLDERFKDSGAYNRFARPVIHGTYHAGRFAFNGGNQEEWARAKDQFSKFGTGQQQTEYLKAHRQQHWTWLEKLFRLIIRFLLYQHEWNKQVNHRSSNFSFLWIDENFALTKKWSLLNVGKVF